MNSGQVFKYIIESKGIKQTWIAERLNRSNDYLCRLFKKAITYEILIQLCNAIDLDLLLFDSIFKEKQKEMSSATAKKPNPSQTHPTEE